MKNLKIIILITSLFIIDQISKIIVVNTINLGNKITIIKNFFNITYTKNYGAAFGIFEGKIFLIIIISILLFAYLIYELKKNKDKKVLVISISLIVGGLLGNLTDRIFLGYVRDFLDFNILGYNYPIFNLSDTFIVIGAVIFTIELIREEINGKERKRNK